MIFDTQIARNVYDPIDVWQNSVHGSIRGSPNGTIRNFTNGTIGSQWCHWLTNGTIGLPLAPLG